MARRIFNIEGYEHEEGYDSGRDAAIQLVVELLTALDHLGGTLTVGTRRQKIGTDQGVTVGWQVMVDSFAPWEEPRDQRPAQALVVEPIDESEPQDAELAAAEA